MKSVVKNFAVEYMQVVDENGNIDQSQMPQIDEPKLKEIYHIMKWTRIFDQKLFLLQRSGKIGTYAQVKGQEAQVATAFALKPTDWVVPSFREMGVYIARGADKVKIVQSWRGDVRANEGNPATARDFTVAIPMSSQCLHACGIAWASKLKKTDEVAITYFGDGATSEGDFYEALNYASVLNLPVIFYNQNNGWAISTPRSKQTNATTIAQKAIGFEVNAIQIDGNDAIAVYKAVSEAAARARAGQGPTLIEAITFRMGDHTTSDDSSRYRSPELVAEWAKKDPIARLELYFKKVGTWSDDYLKWVETTADKETDEAIEKGLAIPLPPPENLFAHVYSTPTWDQLEQLEMVKKEIAQRGAQ